MSWNQLVLWFLNLVKTQIKWPLLIISDQELPEIDKPFLAGHPYTGRRKNRVIQEIQTFPNLYVKRSILCLIHVTKKDNFQEQMYEIDKKRQLSNLSS